jgi:hypothetical protein
LLSGLLFSPADGGGETPMIWLSVDYIFTPHLCKTQVTFENCIQFMPPCSPKWSSYLTFWHFDIFQSRKGIIMPLIVPLVTNSQDSINVHYPWISVRLQQLRKSRKTWIVCTEVRR